MGAFCDMGESLLKSYLENILRLDMRWRRHLGRLSLQGRLCGRRVVVDESLETLQKSVLEMAEI